MRCTRDARRLARRSCFHAVVAVLLACGSSSDGPPTEADPVVQSGYAVTIRPGVSDFGSGRYALTMLATVRDGSGAGPSVAWDARPYDSNGAAVAPQDYYLAPGPGSYVAWTWPEAFVEAPRPLELRIGPSQIDLARVPFLASPPASALGVPRPRLTLDGKGLSWAAVPGAATYRCLVIGQTARAETFQATPACDISALAPGAYMAQVQALSVDLAALGSNPSRTPMLPDRFDVSEGRLGFLVPSPGGTPYQLIAAGGSLRSYGVDYVVVWTSIVSPDGTPAAGPWNMSFSLLGGLPSENTTLDPYPAGATHFFATDGYSLRAKAGDYWLAASSGLGRITTRVHVGAPAQLAEPTGVSPVGAAGGGAVVTWNPVPGAASYLVRAFDASLFDEVARGWTSTSSYTFPDGTFTPGQSYDVYVLATDADMVGGAVPLQVGAAEMAFPVRFTSP